MTTNPAGPGLGKTYRIRLFFQRTTDPNDNGERWLGIRNNFAILVQKKDDAAQVQEFKYDGKTYYKLLSKDYYLSRGQADKALFRNCLGAVSWHIGLDRGCQYLCVDFEGCPPRLPPDPNKKTVTYTLARDFQTESIYCVGEEWGIIAVQQTYELLTAELSEVSPAKLSEAPRNTLPASAELTGRYALQLSYQENGEKKEGWLGEKQVNGKDVAIFVPKNELSENEALVFELIEDSTGDEYYRLPGTPKKEDLYLSIVENDSKIMVGFSGCWTATSWTLEKFIPQWFAGTVADPNAPREDRDRADKEQEADEAAYQGQVLKDKESNSEKKYLVWVRNGKRLALDKDEDGNPDPSKPLVCLCDPFAPTVHNGKQLRDKPDNSVLTVQQVWRASAPQPESTDARALVSPIYQYRAESPWRYQYSKNPHVGHGWTLDGVEFYAFAEQAEGTVPIYQYHAESPWRYQYSKNPHVGHGWTLDGVEFYAFAEQAEGTVPIYQYHAESPWRYQYSKNPHVGHGWTLDGVEFYAFAETP